MKKKNPDDIWKEIVKSHNKDQQLIDDLHLAITENIESSKMATILKYVKLLTQADKSVRILDYGCGGGQLLTYLRFLGYKNLTGIDVKNEEKVTQLNAMHDNMGFGTGVFFNYEGISLPFEDASFDVIISQQVLEHVHNVENYLLEAKRVLSHDGGMLLDFPHRLVPFDTHTRMWFVHYLPPTVRTVIYNRYRNNKASLYSSFLHLHTIWYYKKLLKNMSFSIADMTEDRIGGFLYREHYEGSLGFRLFLDGLMKTPFFGRIFKKTLSLFSIATLIVKK
jgi:SAM-dependent methyltransferase